MNKYLICAYIVFSSGQLLAVQSNSPTLMDPAAASWRRLERLAVERTRWELRWKIIPELAGFLPSQGGDALEITYDGQNHELTVCLRGPSVCSVYQYEGLRILDRKRSWKDIPSIITRSGDGRQPLNNQVDMKSGLAASSRYRNILKVDLSRKEDPSCAGKLAGDEELQQQLREYVRLDPSIREVSVPCGLKTDPSVIVQFEKNSVNNNIVFFGWNEESEGWYEQYEVRLDRDPNSYRQLISIIHSGTRIVIPSSIWKNNK
ncbi:hypothetical protein [Bryobacter aggregatus]|uniref:hypothetical protein n=1 Tax=Bryobacter aggregatus TaxID=360054 RepID=UPI0012BAF827|nr:hypothetical protein [Bryobacter aggregatus]